MTENENEVHPSDLGKEDVLQAKRANLFAHVAGSRPRWLMDHLMPTDRSWIKKRCLLYGHSRTFAFLIFHSFISFILFSLLGFFYFLSDFQFCILVVLAAASKPNFWVVVGVDERGKGVDSCLVFVCVLRVWLSPDRLLVVRVLVTWMLYERCWRLDKRKREKGRRGNARRGEGEKEKRGRERGNQVYEKDFREGPRER